MKSNFARRLMISSTAAAGVTLVVLVFLLAMSGLSLILRGYNARIADTRIDLEELARVHPKWSLGELAHSYANSYFRRSLSVVLLDGMHRVQIAPRDLTARSHHPEDTLITITTRRIGPDTAKSNYWVPRIYGLATLLGLDVGRATIGHLDIVVRGDDMVIADEVSRGIPLVILAEILALFTAYLIGRTLTNQAMRPVWAVTDALERFAEGEQLPSPVDASAYDERLSNAYNAASARMREVLLQREAAYRAMQQCIADAGHQLRTPITVLRGFIGVFRQGNVRDEHDRERIVTTMHKQCLLMSTLVDKLLLLERLEHDEVSSDPIDVGQLVEDVVMPFAEQNPERSVHVNADEGALAAIAPSDLVHVVTNLVDNALKYTQGSIEVHVSKCAEDIILHVSDQGPAMTDDELTHAFDRFYRGASRRNVDGSGLGLPIVKRIVELKGGSVSAEAANGGSRVTVRLPRYR